MKQKQTSLHSLRKMIAATRRYHHEHCIRSARGEQRLERRNIASRGQPAIVSRLIAGGGASMPFMQSPTRPSHADRAEPEQQVDAEQYQQEGEHARVLKLDVSGAAGT